MAIVHTKHSRYKVKKYKRKDRPHGKRRKKPEVVEYKAKRYRTTMGEFD